MSARFNPTHACGHMGKSLPDTASSRAYAAEHVEPFACWSCERADQNARAAEMASTLGLPELVGKSSKQADYGIPCREALRIRMDELVAASPSWEPYADAALYGITDAGWWIDRRESEAADALAWIMPIVDQVRSAIQ